MCPSGFLGKRFARVERGLSLNADPRTWNRDDALRALTEAGDDLSGNLIVGDGSFERWRARRARESEREAEVARFFRGEVDKAAGLSRGADGTVEFDAAEWDEFADIDEWLRNESGDAGSSSLGGERPKISVRRPHGGSLLKFTPPVPPPRELQLRLEANGRSVPTESPQARRWADLLRVEAHCAQTLRANGVTAAEASIEYRLPGRVVLNVVRYDRTPHWGRRGAATLYWYAMERLGDVNLPAPRVVSALVEDGHLQPEDLLLVERVHAFSAAIGNTDAHLGNYGLVFDEEGRAALAPFFDILPMILAPANDELPDARLSRRPRQVIDATVWAWVNELVNRVSADDAISSAFRELWLRTIGL